MTDETPEQKQEVLEVPAQFVPDKVTTYNPDHAMVVPLPGGGVSLTFIMYGSKEVVTINVSPQSAGTLKEDLPASSSILTPPPSRLILPS